MAGNQIEILIQSATAGVAEEGMQAPPQALQLAATGLIVQHLAIVGTQVAEVGKKVDGLKDSLRRDAPKRPRRTVALQLTGLAGFFAAAGALLDRIFK